VAAAATSVALLLDQFAVDVRMRRQVVRAITNDCRSLLERMLDAGATGTLRAGIVKKEEQSSLFAVCHVPRTL
jgi:2-keto-3-deoxy-L-rhamnonate aldolase RhmA